MKIPLMLKNRLSYVKGSPAATAWGILRDLKVQDFPIDPRSIAQALGIVIWERDLPDTCDGCLMQVENITGILVNARIRTASRKNFTIAHEIGHYLLERGTVYACSLTEKINKMMVDKDANVQNRFAQSGCEKDCGTNVHNGFAQSQINSTRSGCAGCEKAKKMYIKREQRANQFATELLMPTPIFLADLSAYAQIGLPAISKLASQYGTSLTSTGIHYTRLSEHVCAIVFSEEGTIRYFAYSNGFRQNRNCYLVCGQSLHPKALASRFANEPYIDEFIDEVPLNYWCKGKEDIRNRTKGRNVHNLRDCGTNVHYKIIEHSRRIPHTKQVMTFLHIPIGYKVI